jgi:hypothetical protein
MQLALDRYQWRILVYKRMNILLSLKRLYLFIWREWRTIGRSERSLLKNWKRRDEEEDSGKDGEKKQKRSSSAGREKMERVGDR